MGFLKSLIRLNTNTIGAVTGGDFAKACYLAPAKKDGHPALLIYSPFREDFVFDKSDITEFKLLESGVPFGIDGKSYVGNKYRIVFKNGQSGILNVVANRCSVIENVLY